MCLLEACFQDTQMYVVEREKKLFCGTKRLDGVEF